MKISRRKSNVAKGTTPEKGIIKDWLAEKGNPEIAKVVAKNLQISNKIAELLETREKSASQLARELGKSRSEISKWLSGQHTFTTRTIAKLEVYFGEDIIHIEPKINNVYWTAVVRVPEDCAPKTEEGEFEESHYTPDYILSA